MRVIAVTTSDGNWICSKVLEEMLVDISIIEQGDCLVLGGRYNGNHLDVAIDIVCSV